MICQNCREQLSCSDQLPDLCHDRSAFDRNPLKTWAPMANKSTQKLWKTRVETRSAPSPAPSSTSAFFCRPLPREHEVAKYQRSNGCAREANHSDEAVRRCSHCRQLCPRHHRRDHADVLCPLESIFRYNLHLEDIILTQKTIEFPDNISALASGAKTHPIAGRVTGFGLLQMFDIAAAMMAEWDHQPKALAEVISSPASATYKDFNRNRFKAIWIWEFHPFRYRQWVSRVLKQTDGWLPDTIGPYLTASAIHTERLPQAVADNSVISSPSRNAGASR